MVAARFWHILLCVAALVAGVYLQLFGFSLPTRPATLIDPEIDGLLWPNQKAVGEFDLVAADGRAFGLSDLKQRWNFVFFGYTHCPDICPLTMQTLRQVKDALPAPNREMINLLFVSVDGERDTPAHLARYIGYFGAGFEAASGTREQVDSLTTQLGVPYQIDAHEPGEDYLVAHSGALYLISPKGNLSAIFRPPHNPTHIATTFLQIQNYLGTR